MGPWARRQAPPSLASRSIPCTLPGSREAAGTNRTKSPSSSRGGGHLREGKEKGHPSSCRLRGAPRPPAPLRGPPAVTAGPRSPGGSRVPVPPQPLVSRGIGLPAPPLLPTPASSRSWCQPSPVSPRYRRPWGPATVTPRTPRLQDLRRLSLVLSQGPGASGGSLLPALPVPPHPRRLQGPGAPRSPGAHPVRMASARCRQRGSTQFGLARSGGIGTARGAGRGGAAGPARPRRVSRDRGSARPQPPGPRLSRPPVFCRREGFGNTPWG